MSKNSRFNGRKISDSLPAPTSQWQVYQCQKDKDFCLGHFLLTGSLVIWLFCAWRTWETTLPGCTSAVHDAKMSCLKRFYLWCAMRNQTRTAASTSRNCDYKEDVPQSRGLWVHFRWKWCWKEPWNSCPGHLKRSITWKPLHCFKFMSLLQNTNFNFRSKNGWNDH